MSNLPCGLMHNAVFVPRAALIDVYYSNILLQWEVNRSSLIKIGTDKFLPKAAITSHK